MVPKWLCFCFAYTAVTLTLSYSNFYSLSLARALALSSPRLLPLLSSLPSPPHTPIIHFSPSDFLNLSPPFLPFLPFLLSQISIHIPLVACLTVLSEVYLPWSLVVSRLGPILVGVDPDLPDILRLLCLVSPTFS